MFFEAMSLQHRGRKSCGNSFWILPGKMFLVASAMLGVRWERGGRVSEPLSVTTACSGCPLSLMFKSGELANTQFQAPLIIESESLENLFFCKSATLGNTDAHQRFSIWNVSQASGHLYRIVLFKQNKTKQKTQCPGRNPDRLSHNL